MISSDDFGFGFFGSGQNHTKSKRSKQRSKQTNKSESPFGFGGGSLLSGLADDAFSFGEPHDAAPRPKQKQWGKFPEAKKQQLRRQHKDTDGDGVPDPWDCQPRNPFRQDRYTEEEMNEISSLGKIKLGNFLGAGAFGAVHEIESENPAMKEIANKYVVKISTDASDFHTGILGGVYFQRRGHKRPAFF